jgi:tetratricopeptide (TPR) repeat protein
MLDVIAYYNHQRLDQLAAEAKSFQERVDNGTYRKEFSVQSHFALAAVDLKARRWPEAIANYDLGIAGGMKKDPFFTWSYLYKGYALDGMGRREEAIAMYKEVLKQMRRWGSWDAAKKRIKDPFKGTDEDLAKIRL